MARLESLKLPGDVRGLVATDPAGPVFVACYSGSRKTVLLAVDRSGTVRWRREFDGRPGLPRAGADGTVWIATGSTLHQIATNGSVLRSVTPDHEDGEHLGAFVLSPDGFYAAWVPTVPGVARLARYGNVTWSAPLPLGALSYRGVVEMRADNGWRARPMKSWTPRRIKLDFRQPLLVAGDRALIDVLDADGGIGVCTILDTATGEMVAATEPAPHGFKAVAGPGRFLVGRQGYGAFSTTLHDRDGRALQQWQSHTMPLVDRHGTIRGPESENMLPSRSMFRILNQDGSLRDGPPLNEYYTTYPALDADGTAVFWRDDKLQTVDADLRMRVLLAHPGRRDGRLTVMSRVLLLDHGVIAFALDRELLIVRDTGLAALDTGPWPCGDGNVRGNPVVAQTPRAS